MRSLPFRNGLKFLLALVVAQGVVWPLAAADPELLKDDEKTLRDAGIGIDGPALLEFFRGQTLDDRDRDEINAVIRKLGHDRFAIREQASRNLVRRGPVAVPLLRQATHDPDIEIARRAERCLEKIDAAPNAAMAMAAARLVADRKPAGAAEVLLNYLPFAEDESVLAELRLALAEVAVMDGQPEAVLIGALEQPDPLLRGAAAEALLRAGADGEIRQAARRLLQDQNSQVRLRVALALVDGREKDGIPVLIDLLGELPPTDAWPAEEVLLQIAADKAPTVVLGRTAEERRQCCEAWQTWWMSHGNKLDLSSFDPAERLLGFTLIVQMDNGLTTGRVEEIGPNRKPRWQITNLNYPLDAQVLPGSRVLIAEYRSNRVTERNFKGEILWQKQVTNPIGCQRLPNGNTVITTRTQLLEVDRKGHIVFSHTCNGYILYGALRLPDGQSLLITNRSQCLRLDAKGKQVKAFTIGRVSSFVNFDYLPTGRILIPEMAANRVVEYDLDGNPVWVARAVYPASAERLPNGHTLVASMNGQRVVELNRDGEEVWNHQVPGRPWHASRR